MWKRLWSFFLPSPGSLVFVWSALILLLIMTLSNVIVYMGDPTIPKFPMLSVVSLPTVAILLGFASLREKRPAGRLLLWSCVVACALTGTINILIFSLSGAGSQKFNEGLFTFMVFPGAPSLGFVLAVWAFLIWRTWPVILELLRVIRSQRLIAMVAARGEAALAEIAGKISMSEAQALALLQELMKARELMAYYDEDYQRIYSAAALNEKRRKMVGIITAQGKIELETLANYLHLNRPLIKQWIYTQARRGQLHGFVDWAVGWVYSFPLDPGTNENFDRCPHCGGELDIAGKGVIECSHCKVEVFR